MLKASAQISNNRGPALRLAILATALFVAASGFMLFLSSGTLAELSRRIHLSAYERLGERFRVSVERGLRFGRPLEGYAGLREQLDNASDMADGMTGMAVVDPEGAQRVLSGVGLGDAAFRRLLAETKDGTEWRRIDGSLALPMPLIGREKRLEGYLVLLASPARILMEQDRFWRRSLGALAALTAVLAIGLYAWAAGAGIAPREQRTRRRYWLCLIFAGGGQILYCLPLMWFFANALSAAEEAKIAVTAKATAWDLERLLSKGVDPARVRGVQPYLEEIRRDNPEILAIRLEEGGQGVAAVGPLPTAPAVDSRPLVASGREAARLDFWMNPAGVRDALWVIARNLATALVISLLLLNEMARFLFGKGGGEEASRILSSPAKSGVSADTARILAFSFFLAYDMSMSFVPLFTATLAGGIRFFPRSVVQALPLTLEAAAVGAGILLAGHRLFGAGLAARLRIGIAAAALGSFASWLAADVGDFCAARAVAGLGFGMFLMSSQIALIGGGGQAKRLGELYSGVLSGSLCGMAAGAMAAELLGFGRIFAVSALAFLPTLIAAGRCFPAGAVSDPIPAKSDAGAETETRRDRPRFLFSFAFLGQVILAAFPAALVLAGLIFYSLPILLERMGTAQGDIGRVLMLHGLSVILAGPLLGRLADARRNYALWIAIAGVLSALAVLVVWLWPSLTGYALATAACGIGCAMMTASGMARITNLATAWGATASGAGGVYRFAERLGQMSGPIVFGLFIGNAGGSGLFWLSLALLAGAAIFFAARNAGVPRDGEA